MSKNGQRETIGVIEKNKVGKESQKVFWVVAISNRIVREDLFEKGIAQEELKEVRK